MMQVSPGAGTPPLWLLVLVTLSGTLAMHMFVPALPDAAQALSTTSGQVQLAVSVYIGGLAIGQLFYGALSDAFGRRPLLLGGLAIYSLSSIGAAFAPDLLSLLVARLLQALGACAGIALGRAIIRDTASTDSAVRQLALLNLMILVGPGLAPILGGVLADTLGWRYIFAVLGAAGVGTLALTWRLLPETANPSGRFGLTALGSAYTELLRSPRFVGLAVGGGCATTSIFAFLAAAPFVFVHELDMPISRAGLYTGLIVAGMGIGSAITGWLAGRVAPEWLLRGGNILSLVAAIALLLIVLKGALSVTTVVLLMAAYACGCGIASPAALVQVISVVARRTGSAAGLYGSIQMSVGALCTTLAASGSNPAVSALVVMVAASGIAAIAFAVGWRAAPQDE